MRIFFVITCVFIVYAYFLPQAHAHPLLPPEVNAFIIENPEATDEDVEKFIVENYGLEELRRLQAIHENSGDDGIYNVDELTIAERANLLLDVKNDRLSFGENFVKFMLLGVDHILKGTDHVLFVLALVLVAVPWRRLLLMITTFTIAHSITLILAGLSIISLSPRIVEPVIALSIAYMALTSVFLRQYAFFAAFHNRLGVIFFFGLFHGLGFAGVFEELDVPVADYFFSLAFFNIGVEIGQLIILAVAVLALYFLSKRPALHGIVIKFAAIIVSLLALSWFFERI